MKRFTGLLVFTLIFALTAAQVPCAAAQEPDDYILRLSENADLSGLSFTPQMIGENVCAASAAQTAELLRLSVVACVTHNDVLTTQDAYSANEWSHIQIGAESAWNHTDSGGYDCRGDGVTVAVIDSVAYELPDFYSAYILPVDCVYEGYTHWHGTFVTGIIASQLNGLYADGIAPNVNILSLCITDYGGNTSTAQAIAAINYAVERGADVINLSIGGTARNELLEEACQTAVDAGVIVVACVGNAGSEADAAIPRYPAAFDCVISVSACTEGDDGVAFADFSCHNDMVDVCAPGGGITSLYVDGSIATKSGTSFASPVVTAMAAIAKQHDPMIDSEGFLAILEETCTDFDAAGKDVYFGRGLVDIPRFVDAICSDDETIPQPEEEQLPVQEEAPASGGEGAVLSGREEPGIPDQEATMPEETERPFEDVFRKDYYYDAVQWAVGNGITEGIDSVHFAPNAECTRAQMVTFLYRAAGCPETALTCCPFMDVDSSSYYYRAVLWAYENGITKGATETKFGANDCVTREQAVTFLWRFADSPGLETLAGVDTDIQQYSDFSDVSDYAADAFRWAVAKRITTGTSGTTLGPQADCLRGQIVTFLWRLAGQ